MSVLISDYLANVAKRYKLGNATEHTFRGDLQHLIENLVPGIAATNEPKRIKCGAPDYVITKKDIPVGYIEAKDLGVDLLSKNNKEQFDRYKESLENLIITDYKDFHFYAQGSLVRSISIAEIGSNGISPIRENFDEFADLIVNFCSFSGQTIRSPKKLAEMMAIKARLLAQFIETSLKSDADSNEDSTLKEQFLSFKQILINDIDEKGFSDVYAQTIAYGMFAARLYDTTLDTFSRKEAAELIPKSNPFLRKLFQYIAGYDLDERISWIVDALADIFRSTDVAALLKNFGKATKQEDPIIHFYETFLANYDPKLRKARGVWYTPEPVVDFIVRAVDDILKTEFDLPDGLADTSKTKIKVPIPTHDQRFKGGMRDIEQEVHRVQILDPATGTGTFLAKVIEHIHQAKFANQKGMWSQYVENHLIPRLNGFELLMASYAMAHLKLDLLLMETGYKPTKNQRLRVYLTNSLEEHHKDTGTLFASWLSAEANEANQIKRDTPVMVVIGNPPYSISSSNKIRWIENLIQDYKDGVIEQNLNALSDDYVKFLRYGQHLINKNGSGIMAMITNNSFIDGVTQRGMRKSLLDTFDKIFVIDLHGSLKRKEKTIDGKKDDNVFDIQQGVAVSIFIKRKISSKKSIQFFDILGLREDKYNFLHENKLSTIQWKDVLYSNPYYFFIPKNGLGQSEFDSGFKITDLFLKSGNGVKFRKDNLLVKNFFTKEDVLRMLKDINFLNEETFYKKYETTKTPDWEFSEKKKLFEERDSKNTVKVDYRLFDSRFTYYPLDKISQIIVRGDSRKNLMENYLLGKNLGLIIGRQGQVVGNMPWNLIFISREITDMNIFYRGGGINFPLYIYTTSNGQQSFESHTPKIPNLDNKILKQIENGLGLKFIQEKEEGTNSFAPIDLLDYIYAVLHSPNYREKYKEFLKIDFPRVPYPTDQETFWKLVDLGGQIRELHLMESPTLNRLITGYPEDGNSVVDKPIYKDGKVWINQSQYFEGVPELAWNFYIGGYQPAQKWLKDRKGRQLSYDDILHYQKIILALADTDRLMKEIDGVIEF